MANTDPKLPLPEQAAVQEQAAVADQAQAALVTACETHNQTLDAQQVADQAQAALVTAEQEGHTSTSSSLPVVAVRNLTKIYLLGGKTRVPALQGVSLEVYPGEFVAIMGPSGSGKSTFMNLIGGLDRPTEGEYWLAGNLVSHLSNDKLAHMRNRLIGFVFQGFNLLGRATALRNVALPMVYAGLSRRERERRARKVLQLVGLGDRENHRPSELSGGQQQRVAIARALINGPALLLADEPTGNLDSHTSVEIMGVLQALNEQGLTIVLVTHDPNIAQYAARRVTFLDGRVVRDEPVLSRRSAVEEWRALVNPPAVASETVVKEGILENHPSNDAITSPPERVVSTYGQEGCKEETS